MNNVMKLLIFAFSCLLGSTYGLKCMQREDARLIKPFFHIPTDWFDRGWHTGQYLSTKHNDEGEHHDESHDRGVAFTPNGTRIWWLQGPLNDTYYLITHNLKQILCTHTVGGLQVNWFENTIANLEEEWCQWNIEVNPDDASMFRLKNHMLVETLPQVGFVYFGLTGLYFDYNENALNDIHNVVSADKTWFVWQKADDNQRDFSDIEDECFSRPSALLETPGNGITGRSASGRRRYFPSSNNFASCSSKWFLFENKCYRFFKRKLRQPKAKFICQVLDSSLATPKSSEESKFMDRVLNDKLRKPKRRKRRKQFWLGATRENNLEKFKYQDGSSLVYEKFNKQNLKFSSATQTCAFSANRKWRPAHCNAIHRFFCVRQATQKQVISCGKIQDNNIDMLMRRAGERIKVSDRIVNGETAEEGQFPWQASLRFKTPVRHQGIDVIHNCGGTLIDECWVLTAAHCVPGRDSNIFKVRLGDLNNVVDDSTEQEFDIERVIVHDQYTMIPSPRSDIALIKLRKKNGKCALINSVIQPACLPASIDSVVEEGQKCQVSGWGVTNTSLGQSSAAENLMWVTLPKFNNTYCKNKYNKRTELFVDNLMFCAGSKKGGKDSCTGDSGGPYVCRNEQGEYVLTGIVSFGVGCARRAYPGVYTNVAHFLPWITSNIQANGGGSLVGS